MTRKPRLLIVEDEPAIRTGLVDVFIYHGYEVEAAVDGDQGLGRALSGRFDLVLLDVMLPGRNGFDVLAAIRQNDREQPVIMLTAKSTDEDVVHGLSLGADDYVAKPFSIAQLVLRVQAVLRRAHVGLEGDGMIRLRADCRVDVRNLSAHTAHGEIAFTRREMELLQYLAAHTERPVPLVGFLLLVWGYARHLDIETRTVDIHIVGLRRKVEPNAAEPTLIQTVRGKGYRWFS